jgi:DNA processing protein
MDAPLQVDDRRRAWIALAQLPRLGPLRLARALERLDTPERILAASKRALREAGIDAESSGLIRRGEALRRADEAIERAAREGWSLVVPDDDAYPNALGEIQDPPTALWARGDPGACDAVAVAVVGSRRATPYGLRTAEGLGSSLASAGVTVVSGMARGIDSAAHEGALAAGGRTLAILGSGLANLYPPESGGLASRIAASGALLSELPPDTEPKPSHFPRRNRIISGLSRAVVVVEATADSGSLITAKLALDQGREVGAVPGPVHRETSTGPHCLIRDGAFLVQRAEDVLEVVLGPAGGRLAGASPLPAAATPSPPLAPFEEAVFGLLDPDEPISVDRLLSRSERTAGEVLEALFSLELRGLVRTLPGGTYLRRP